MVFNILPNPNIPWFYYSIINSMNRLKACRINGQVSLKLRSGNVTQASSDSREYPQGLLHSAEINWPESTCFWGKRTPYYRPWIQLVRLKTHLKYMSPTSLGFCYVSINITHSREFNSRSYLKILCKPMWLYCCSTLNLNYNF